MFTEVVLIGIQRGGVPLAKRLAGLLSGIWGQAIPSGSLDVSMHRDDLGHRIAPDVQPTDEALDRGLRSKCQDSPDRDICVRQRFLARQQRGRRQLTLNECAVTYG